MARQELQKTPLWQLRQLLIPNARDHGSDFEVEVKRLGILGLQFASIVAIVLPSAVIFFEAALVYFKEGDVTVGQLLKHNIENFAIVLVGITALFLSRTDIGQARPNFVAVACTTIAEMIATLSLLLQGSFTTYPPFVISLLIMTVVVPLRPITIALIGFLLVGFHYLIEALFTYAAIIPVETAKQITTVPVEFLVTITLVCMSLTAVIYRLRLNNFLSLEALKRSQKRLQRELAAAGNIQMHSLPRHNPVVPGFSIAGACVTATEVGGDYYDYLESSNGKLGVVVGDVSGKGTFAALYMSKLQGIIRALEQYHDSPKTLLSVVNHHIYGKIERNCFITLTCAVFDVKKKRMTLSRAGHNATLLFRDQQLQYLVPRGLGVGLAGRAIFDAEVEEQVVNLKANDILLFYTDGVVEARNRSGEEFGEARLIRTVQDRVQNDANELAKAIMEEVRQFIGYARQHDDMTILVAKVLP